MTTGNDHADEISLITQALSMFCISPFRMMLYFGDIRRSLWYMGSSIFSSKSCSTVTSNGSKSSNQRAISPLPITIFFSALRVFLLKWVRFASMISSSDELISRPSFISIITNYPFLLSLLKDSCSAGSESVVNSSLSVTSQQLL